MVPVEIVPLPKISLAKTRLLSVVFGFPLRPV